MDFHSVFSIICLKWNVSQDIIYVIRRGGNAMNFFESGKTKAVTFSYDDGITQDINLVELLNKYGLKCTFNINSERLG